MLILKMGLQPKHAQHGGGHQAIGLPKIGQREIQRHKAPEPIAGSGAQLRSNKGHRTAFYEFGAQLLCSSAAAVVTRR